MTRYNFPDLRDTRGQAVVEFALVMPILLLIVIGIIEFGRAWNTQQALTDAAREGARTSVMYDLQTTPDTVRQAIHGVMTSVGLDTADAAITMPACLSVSRDSCGRGGFSTIGISYDYSFAFLGPLMNWTTEKSTLTLNTEVTMRFE